MVTTLINAKELKEKTLQVIEERLENDFKSLVRTINHLASCGRFNCVVSDFNGFTPHGVVDSGAVNVMEVETYYNYLKKCGYGISQYSINSPSGQKAVYYVISWKDV